MAAIDHTVATALALGYLLGSIPFGLILTAVVGGGDLRRIGSGNIGATNVLRTGHKGAALLTVALDVFKAFAAVQIGSVIAPGWGEWAGAAALIGHCFPVWLAFRGGKGVASYGGLMWGISWQLGLVYTLAWLITLAASRLSSAAGVVAALSAPIAAVVAGPVGSAPLLWVLSAIVIFKHRLNLRRIARGEEPRVGQRTG